MFPVQAVTDVQVAYPAKVKDLMPPKRLLVGFVPDLKWQRLFSDWYFGGLTHLEIVPREGIDTYKALRHIRCIMRSFEPKHEDKTDAVVFLMQEWFLDATWTMRPPKP